LLTDPSANMSVFFFAGHSSDVLNLMLVVVVLWVTVKIPGLARHRPPHPPSPPRRRISPRRTGHRRTSRRVANAR